MSRLAGQAARIAGRALLATASIALGFAAVLTIAAGALIWRLSEGPIELKGLIPRLDALIDAEAAPMRVQVGSLALAWEGWRGGVDRPVDLRLGGLVLADASGTEFARIPRAELSLSFGWLLLGRVVPRAIEIEGAHIRAVRTAEGEVSLGFVGDAALADASEGTGKPFAELLAELARPYEDDRSNVRALRPRWTQLRRVRIAGADLVLVDRRLGTVWHAPWAGFDLARHRAGGVTASADLEVELGGRTVPLAGQAAMPAGGQGAQVQLRFGQLDPAAVARAIPDLKPLAALQAPLQGTARLDLGPDFAWRTGELHAELGEGAVQVGQGLVPILGATLSADAVPDHARLRQLRLVLAGAKGAGPVAQARGELSRADGHLFGTLEAELDQVAMADLSRYWPGDAVRGARNWVTRNVTAGTARAAHVSLAVRANENGSDLVLSQLGGHISGDDLTIHWLRPVPPVEHVRAELTLLSPDALLITTQGGREAGTAQAGILARNGSVKVTHLEDKDQYGDIQVDLVGSVPDTLALLRQPRLHLLDKHPMELRNPSGQAMAKLSLNLLLDERVTFDSIPIHATGQLSALHLSGVLAKQDLDHGLLDLDVDNDGMRLDGTGDIGGIPAEIGIQRDFRAGPVTQVVQRYTVSASPTAQQLASFGLDSGGAVSGSLGLQATVLERRSGAGEADIQGDLKGAELKIAPLGWSKPRGPAAAASARVLLNQDKIVGIDRLELQGEGFSVGGAVDFAGGQPEVVRLDRVVLGNTRGVGDVRLAAGPGDPVRLTFAGSSLDLSARLAQQGLGKSTPGADEPGKPWAADLGFGRILLGENRALSEVTAHAESDGRVLTHARIQGRTGQADGFSVVIAPEVSGAGRRLTIEAADAGALLRALNLLGSVAGGTLALSARYDDTRAGHPLYGTAGISSFRLRDAPAATRLLQAMTLYGLVSALRGPGLGFSSLVAPFRLEGDVLQLDDARASSPSLGFTARGRIDLARRVADVRGTIVPAYLFNSMLGRIPILGNLFSPEKGGGVFAATYAVTGRLDDPAVTINPLAALTPGFLRGLFGILPGGGVGQSRAAAVP